MLKTLTDGGVAVGTSASPTTDTRFLANAGFDFLFFDTQHSTAHIKELDRPIAAMRGTPTVPIVRVGDNVAEQICYALDVGARGIIVPMVNTADEAESMVQACKYPPAGVRSSAGARGSWGNFQGYREYMDSVNDNLLIIPMVETLKALENLNSIASTAGVNCVLIGPSDLSIALDIPLDYENPKYHDAIASVASTCRENGVAPGMFFVPPRISTNTLIEMGFQFFTVGWQPWAAAAISSECAKIRGG